LLGIQGHLTPVLYKKSITKKKSITSNPESAKYILVLSATVDEINKPLVEALIAHLRLISGDTSMTLQKIESGSVKLFLEGSQEGLEQILALLNEGKLTEILGIPIQSVQVLANQEQVEKTIPNSQYQALINGSRQEGIVGYGNNSMATIIELNDSNLTMATVAEQLAQEWYSRLEIECSEQNATNRESIVNWLLGSDRNRFDELECKD
jgi:hypothetical protein